MSQLLIFKVDSYRLQFIRARKSSQQEPEGAGDITSTVREENSFLKKLLYSLESPTQGMVPPTVRRFKIIPHRRTQRSLFQVILGFDKLIINTNHHRARDFSPSISSIFKWTYLYLLYCGILMFCFCHRFRDGEGCYIRNDKSLIQI